MKSGIYEITNTISSKKYIGSAKELNRRKETHFTQLRKNIHHNNYLQNAWNLYGEEAFEFTILEFCEINQLVLREQYYIDLYPFETLYNICPKAGSRLGAKASQETKEKASSRQLQFYKDHPEAKEKCSNKGDKHPQFGKLVNEKTKAKISYTLKEKNIKPTKEHMEKLKELATGRVLSKEVKLKIRENNLGKKRTQETKDNLKKNHWTHREDHLEIRKRMSEAQKKRFNK